MSPTLPFTPSESEAGLNEHAIHRRIRWFALGMSILPLERRKVSDIEPNARGRTHQIGNLKSWRGEQRLRRGNMCVFKTVIWLPLSLLPGKPVSQLNVVSLTVVNRS